MDRAFCFYKVLFLEGQQQIAGIDAIACSNVNLVDNTVLFGNDSCLQFHGFEYEQRLVLFHFFAFFDEYLADCTRNCRTNMSRVGLIGFQFLIGLNFKLLILNSDFTDRTVDFKAEDTFAFLIRCRHFHKLDQQIFTFANLKGCFLTAAQAIEVNMAFKSCNIVVCLEMFAVIFIYLWIEA